MSDKPWDELLGPVVLDESATTNGECICGEKRPHVHDVSEVKDIQEWYQTGVLPQ